MTPSAHSVHLCAALRVEARALANRNRRRDNVVVVGMRARRRDRLAALAALADDGDLITLVGFGGGLDPARRAGDVVVATEIQHAGERVALPRATELLVRLRNAGVVAFGGPIWCSTHIVRGTQRAAMAATGAVAVDMESAALADACGADRLVVVRVIVDTPARGLLLGCLLDGLPAWRALRDVGTALRALRDVGTALRALRDVGTALRGTDRSTRDDSITSGTVKSGGTPMTSGLTPH